MPRRRRSLLEWNKATLALALVSAVLALEIVGYIVMVTMGNTVPDMYVSFMYTTLTGLLAVAGAQYVNGKAAQGGH